MTPKDLKLCDSDYKFMTAVWESCPVNSGELVRLCNEKFGWKKSTVYTMIKKMELKGFVENVNATVTALIPEEACQREEAQYFNNFLASFPGMKMQRIFPFKEISAFRFFAVSTVIYRTSLTLIPVAQIVSIRRASPFFPFLRAVFTRF